MPQSLLASVKGAEDRCGRPEGRGRGSGIPGTGARLAQGVARPSLKDP